MSLTTVPSASRVALAFGMALAIGAAATMDAGQSPAGAPARAALYTDAQATAGEALYRQSCSGCHGATLIGGTAPPLTGPAFETSWSDPRVTLADAFFIARTTMPPRASNTLTAQDHAAVFAYILKMNGFPAGTTLLTADVGAAGIGARRDRESGGAIGGAGVHSGFRSRGASVEWTGSGDPDGRLAIDGLAGSHPRLRRHALLATAGGQCDHCATARTDVPVPGRRPRQFSDGADRLQRHDVHHDHRQHDRARRGDVPREVAARVAVARDGGIPAQSRRRDQGRSRIPRHARRLPAGAQCRDRRSAVGAADREAGRRRDSS